MKQWNRAHCGICMHACMHPLAREVVFFCGWHKSWLSESGAHMFVSAPILLRVCCCPVSNVQRPVSSAQYRPVPSVHPSTYSFTTSVISVPSNLAFFLLPSSKVVDRMWAYSSLWPCRCPGAKPMSLLLLLQKHVDCDPIPTPVHLSSFLPSLPPSYAILLLFWIWLDLIRISWKEEEKKGIAYEIIVNVNHN